MHNLHNTDQAGFYDEESIASTFRALGLQLTSLERFPSFGLGFDLEGQYARHSKHLTGWILCQGID